MHRRFVIPTVLALLLAMAAPATADVKPFDAKAFEAAQAAGDSIVVDVAATW